MSWKDRKLVVPALKAIYRAKNAKAGLKALAEFETSFWGQRYPAIAQSWQRNWEHVVPFFAYPESVRRIIYTSQLQLLRLLQRGYRSGRHRCSRKSEHAWRREDAHGYGLRLELRLTLDP